MEQVVSLAIAVLGALLFTVRLRRVRALPREQAGGASAQVSIIVPARDEAQNLPTLLGSLRALEPAPLEIIVVDDHSSDNTAQIAAAHGARVVVPAPRPATFIGKPWASLAGAAVARGRYLLFTDADTWHAPRSLSRALAALAEPGVGLVSIVPTHRVVARWERLQGVFQLLLLIATRADARSARRPTARPFAIGQYLLFRRESYEGIGGHAAAPQRIAEDLALAELVARAGYGVRVLFAKDSLVVRMYPEGLAGFVAGWRRNFRDGLHAAGLASALELTLVIGWLLGVPLWLGRALVLGQWAWAWAWAASYGLTALLIAREQRHYGAFPRPSAAAYPLFTLLFVAVTCASLWDALRGRPVTWRGRTFALLR